MKSASCNRKACHILPVRITYKKKKSHQDREREARKEMHENELEVMERQHKRMMEETQESRVNSWRDFQDKAGRKRKQGA